MTLWCSTRRQGKRQGLLHRKHLFQDAPLRSQPQCCIPVVCVSSTILVPSTTRSPSMATKCTALHNLTGGVIVRCCSLPRSGRRRDSPITGAIIGFSRRAIPLPLPSLRTYLQHGLPSKVCRSLLVEVCKGPHVATFHNTYFTGADLSIARVYMVSTILYSKH